MGFSDRFNGAGNIEAMEFVPDLLPLVSEDLVRPSLELGLDEKGEEAIQFNARVIRTVRNSRSGGKSSSY